ncbi:transcriptional regulator [Salmonella enterica subsp. enterica serovar Choleraesuis]|nr:transcriptional regulator [Salmonella enterica subsp. enterica serovar Choleraesuis]
MQREEVLEHALEILELNGLANATPAMVASHAGMELTDLQRFWPDHEALLYDALRYHSEQIESLRRQLFHDKSRSPQQKILARYETLGGCVDKKRYPGCLFIAACGFYPDRDHPIHQLAERQKRAAWEFTHELLTQLGVDDPAMVAAQLELVLEGCLSRLLVKHNRADVETASRLAEDILRIAQCRAGGAFG